MRIQCLASALLVLLIGLPLSAAAPTDSPLVAAARRSDKAAVQALLKRQVNVNRPTADGTTALHWAAYRADVDIAEMLIRAGANVRAVNRYGVSPLSLACKSSSASVIEALLKAGADPNTTLPEGETALMTAARTGNVDALTILLSHGADVNATEHWRGETALMWAAAEGHAEAIALLARAGAEIDARSSGAQTTARPKLPETAPPGSVASPTAKNSGATATAGTSPAAAPKATSRPPASPLTLTFTPLLFAARAGHIDAAKALLAAGADVNETVSDGTSALVLAIMNAHFELANVLLDHGANPNADATGWTALHQLAWTRRPNFGRPPPPPIPTGNMDSLDLAKALLARGANPNAREKKEPRDTNRNALNRIGATPFFLAAKAADVDLMRVLVAAGADPKLGNVDHTTPLMVAAGVGIYKVGESPGTNEEAIEAVTLTCELGNDVNAVDDNGDTALHGAALRGANNIVQFLVDKGIKLAYIDAKDSKGWSPLGIADGIFHISVFISQPQTAVLLRKLQRDAATKAPPSAPAPAASAAARPLTWAALA